MLNPRTRQLQRWIAPIWILLLAVVVLAPPVAGYLMFAHAYGDSDLVAAAARGDAAEVRRRLEAGSPADSFHLEGSSALWWAVSSGSLEAVELLLRHGADPNHGGQWGTLAQEAVGTLDYDDGKPRREIVKLLLQHASRFRDPRDVEILKSALADAKRARPPEKERAGADPE